MKETLLIPWGSSWWEEIVARQPHTAAGQPVIRFRVLCCPRVGHTDGKNKRMTNEYPMNPMNWIFVGQSRSQLGLLTMFAVQTEFEGTSERREESQRWDAKKAYHGSCPRFQRTELWSCSRSWIMKSRSGKWNDCAGNGNKYICVHVLHLLSPR